MTAIGTFFYKETKELIKANDSNLAEHKKQAITVAHCTPCQQLAEVHRAVIEKDIKEIKTDVKDMQKDFRQMQTDMKAVIDLALNR